MALGTDELEWWDDRESYLKIAALQHSEMSITKVEVRRTVAWKEGGLGWVAGELCLSLASPRAPMAETFWLLENFFRVWVGRSPLGARQPSLSRVSMAPPTFFILTGRRCFLSLTFC